MFKINFSDINWRRGLAPSCGFKRVIYLVIVFALFLFLQAEVYLRAHGYYPQSVLARCDSDPLYDWLKLTDHISVRGSVISKEDPNVLENTNADTSRRSWSSEKTDYDSRVLVVGCSQTFGMGVADEQTLVWLLNKHYPRTRFDNFGVKGYGTYQCLLTMQYWLEQRHYDGVIYFYIRDHGPRSAKLHLLPAPNQKYRLGPYAEFDLFGRLHTRPYYTLDNFASLSSSAYSFIRYYYYLALYKLEQRQSPEQQEMKYRKLTAALIKEMEATAKRHRVRLAIFDMDPIMPGERAPELQGVVNIGNFRFNGPEYRVARQPQNHPNDKVHAYWAQKTIEWIDANHWLDFGKTTQGVASRK
ncbi:MAG: hypothetical protein ACI37J_09000 [Candidatus Bruticola sp.]